MMTLFIACGVFTAKLFTDDIGICALMITVGFCNDNLNFLVPWNLFVLVYTHIIAFVIGYPLFTLNLLPILMDVIFSFILSL